MGLLKSSRQPHEAGARNADQQPTEYHCDCLVVMAQPGREELWGERPSDDPKRDKGERHQPAAPKVHRAQQSSAAHRDQLRVSWEEGPVKRLDTQLQESSGSVGDGVFPELGRREHSTECNPICIRHQHSDERCEGHARGKTPHLSNQLYAKHRVRGSAHKDHPPQHLPSHQRLDRCDRDLPREEPHDIRLPEEHDDAPAVPHRVPEDLESIHPSLRLQAGQAVRIQGDGKLEAQRDCDQLQGPADGRGR